LVDFLAKLVANIRSGKEPEQSEAEVLAGLYGYKTKRH